MAAPRTFVTVDFGTLELRKRAQRLADRNDRSLSAEVRLAIKERLEREEKKPS